MWICQQKERHHIVSGEMDISSTSAFDVSMTSEPATDPADISFVPLSSPSTSTTGSSASLSGPHRGWKERKWMVNESKLMELFRKCTICGVVMCDLNQNIKHLPAEYKSHGNATMDTLGNGSHVPILGEWLKITSFQQQPHFSQVQHTQTLLTGLGY